EERGRGALQPPCRIDHPVDEPCGALNAIADLEQRRNAALLTHDDAVPHAHPEREFVRAAVRVALEEPVEEGVVEVAGFAEPRALEFAERRAVGGLVPA